MVGKTWKFANVCQYVCYRIYGYLWSDSLAKLFLPWKSFNHVDIGSKGRSTHHAWGVLKRGQSQWENYGVEIIIL